VLPALLALVLVHLNSELELLGLVVLGPESVGRVLVMRLWLRMWLLEVAGLERLAMKLHNKLRPMRVYPKQLQEE
jgi:hypothetical protein